MKSEFVEKFADFIFKLHNIGVQDMQASLNTFIRMLYDSTRVFDLMPFSEMLGWVYKLYSNLVQTTGINRRKSQANKQIMSLEESSITGNSATQDSGHMYGTPNNIF